MRRLPRGGGTGPHAEERGPASAMERDLRIVKEPEAARASDCAACIRNQRFQPGKSRPFTWDGKLGK